MLKFSFILKSSFQIKIVFKRYNTSLIEKYFCFLLKSSGLLTVRLMYFSFPILILRRISSGLYWNSFPVCSVEKLFINNFDLHTFVKIAVKIIAVLLEKWIFVFAIVYRYFIFIDHKLSFHIPLMINSMYHYQLFYILIINLSIS